ncbi:MAG: NAD(P)H:quinone oxidoreductase, type IV [Betaproteobacteria bacterium TMED22]|nr:MAG: NAD(P)H:quinone oxidoreductase, type IV [Betaproteobacteria bacterium TMED22]
MSEILVLYYSRNGSVQQMAKLVARGIEMVPGVSARVRTVPSVSANTEQTEATIPDAGAPYVEIDDLRDCIGLALGSPTRFGNMSSAMKYFIDQLGTIWHAGELIGKPATVFTSASSMHGGQEITLATMMFPLIHLGMVVTGIPYSEHELHTTMTGGTPYGSSHFAGQEGKLPISAEEKSLCIAQGKRLATIALKLNS